MVNGGGRGESSQRLVTRYAYFLSSVVLVNKFCLTYCFNHSLACSAPYLVRFRIEKLNKDTIGLFSKRVCNIAESITSCDGKKLDVHLNGKKLPGKDLKSGGVTHPTAFGLIDERWEVGVGVSSNQSFQHISFVDFIAITKQPGGTEDLGNREEEEQQGDRHQAGPDQKPPCHLRQLPRGETHV